MTTADNDAHWAPLECYPVPVPEPGDTVVVIGDDGRHRPATLVATIASDPMWAYVRLIPSTDRDLLAEAMYACHSLNYETLADALLPVVDRIANERAAAELRAAADDPGSAHVVELRDGRSHRVIPVRDLYDRAAALDPP